MRLTIAYLYYNLLNLYGENGNIKIIKKALENQGINVMVKFLSIDDELDFKSYDLVYIGSGTYQNQEIIIKHLLRYRKEIEDSINNKKFFIITGNAIDLFGMYILNNKRKIKCLDIFNYYIKLEDINFSDRACFRCNLVDDEVIGYIRKNSLMFNNDNHLFEVIEGIGANIESKEEGIHYKNFYGTYLIGPFLIRNPHFTIQILKKLILSKDQSFKFKKFNFDFELKAYQSYLYFNYGIKKQTFSLF